MLLLLVLDKEGGHAVAVVVPPPQRLLPTIYHSRLVAANKASCASPTLTSGYVSSESEIELTSNCYQFKVANLAGVHAVTLNRCRTLPQLYRPSETRFDILIPSYHFVHDVS